MPRAKKVNSKYTIKKSASRKVHQDGKRQTVEEVNPKMFFGQKL